MTPQDVRDASRPLLFIFWGALICIIDISFSEVTNGEGFKFDIVNDVVGAVLIAVGVSRLGRIDVNPRYASAMTFVKVMAVFNILTAVLDHFIFRQPEALALLLLVIGMASLAAIILFCVAMRWFCEVAGLPRSWSSWGTTLILFVIIYAAPLGIFYVVGASALLTGKSFHFNLGPAGLLLVPVFILPVIHFLVSTRRMVRESESPSWAGRSDDISPAPPAM